MERIGLLGVLSKYHGPGRVAGRLWGSFSVGRQSGDAPERRLADLLRSTDLLCVFPVIALRMILELFVGAQFIQAGAQCYSVFIQSKIWV